MVLINTCTATNQTGGFFLIYHIILCITSCYVLPIDLTFPLCFLDFFHEDSSLVQKQPRELQVKLVEQPLPSTLGLLHVALAFTRSRSGTTCEDICLVSVQAPIKHLCCSGRKQAACPIFPSLSRRGEGSRGAGEGCRHREGWRDTKCCGWHLNKSRAGVTVAAAFCARRKKKR